MNAVVIPVYNRPDCLREALDSVVAQTKKMFFTVVVDDCSTEDIQSVCDDFRDRLHLVYLKTKENGGPGMARQTGIDWCAARNIEGIIFLDADDLLYPNAVQRLTYELNHRLCDVITSPISVEEKNGCGNIIDPGFAANIWMHGKIIRVSFLVKNNIRFKPGLRGNEDVNFMLKCNGLTQKHAYIEEPVYLWRDEKHSITRGNEVAVRAIGSIDYIEAVTDAFKFLRGTGQDISKYVHYVPTFYKYYQKGLIFGNITPEIDKMLDEFLAFPEIINEIKDRRFWYKADRNAVQYVIEKKKVQFFKQTFYEWLLEHGLPKGVLDEISGG